MTDEEVFREWLHVTKLGYNDLTEHDYDYLRESAQFQEFLLCYRLHELGIAITASVRELCRQMCNAMQPLADFSFFERIPRTPVEIKKDIKREKNPLRLKQLNKELNDAYKSRIGRKR
jgi:hypothetical protein